MLAFSRSNPFEDIFNFQQEVDRVFNRFWNDLPARTAGMSQSFHVSANGADEWTIDVPLPGIDPKDVQLEVSGSTLRIRVQAPGDKQAAGVLYEQAFAIPQFLDVERISATHRHGMLRLTLPLKESIKPRRLQIATEEESQKQLTHA